MTENQMKKFQKFLFKGDVANGVVNVDGTPLNHMLSKEENMYHFNVLSSLYIQLCDWEDNIPTYAGWTKFLQMVENGVRYNIITPTYMRVMLTLLEQSDVTKESLVKYLD